MSETAISKAIAETLERCGLIVIRIQSGKINVGRRWIHLAPAGTPDRVVLCPGGRTVWLEIKQPGEKPEPEQVEMHERFRALGHEVAVVDSVRAAVEVCLDTVCQIGTD